MQGIILKTRLGCKHILFSFFLSQRKSEATGVLVRNLIGGWSVFLWKCCGLAE